MNGFLNILKPPGMTSAAVVGYVRRMTGEKRVGHAGTLDPEAAGVLPIMIGRAARLFDYLVDKEKTYVAECALCRRLFLKKPMNSLKPILFFQTKMTVIYFRL